MTTSMHAWGRSRAVNNKHERVTPATSSTLLLSLFTTRLYKKPRPFSATPGTAWLQSNAAATASAAFMSTASFSACRLRRRTRIMPFSTAAVMETATENGD